MLIVAIYFNHQLMCMHVDWSYIACSFKFTVDARTGLLSDNSPIRSFRINDLGYIRRRQIAVVHMTPHIPVDVEAEASAFSILLLHHPWPDGTEQSIIAPSESAISTLANYTKQGDLLPHVLQLIEGFRENDEVISDIRLRSAEYSSFQTSYHDITMFEQEQDIDATEDFNDGK